MPRREVLGAILGAIVGWWVGITVCPVQICCPTDPEASLLIPLTVVAYAYGGLTLGAGIGATLTRASEAP